MNDPHANNIKDVLAKLKAKLPAGTLEREALGPPDLPRQWPPELIALAKTPGKKVFFCEPAYTPLQCYNCGGSETMMIFEVERGPYNSVPMTTSEKVMTWYDGHWYVGTHQSAPCPVCAEDHRSEWMSKISGLKPNELSVRLDQFISYPGKEDARRMAAYLISIAPGGTGFTTFHGLPGRGKTHLLMSIVNAYRMIGVPSIYKTVPDLLAEIRATYDNPHEHAEEIIKRYRAIHVFALDEFNLEVSRITDWGREILIRIIDDRYRNREAVLTVIASMNSPAELVKIGGDVWESVSSRMLENDIIEVGGSDVRTLHANRKDKS